MYYPDIMTDTIIQTKMVSTLMTIIVAVILVGVVMAPIINELGKSDSDSGSGGVVPPTLTNTGINYATADSGTHIMNIQLVDDDFILTVDGQQIDVGFDYVPWDDENPPTVMNNITLIAGQADDGYPILIILDMSGHIANTAGGLEISMGETPNVTLTITSTGISYDGGEDEFIVNYLVSATGDYVMTANPHIYPNTEFEICYMDSQQVMIHEVTTDEGEVIDDSTSPGDWPRFFGKGYVATITSNFGWDGPYINPTITVNTTESEGYIILNNIQIDDGDTAYGRDGTITVSDWTMYARLFLVPKTITYSSEPITYTNQGNAYFASADADSVQHTMSVTVDYAGIASMTVDGQEIPYTGSSAIKTLAYGSEYLCLIYDENVSSGDINEKLVWIDSDKDITHITPTSHTINDYNGEISTETYQFTIQNGKIRWTNESNQTVETPIDIYQSYEGDYVTFLSSQPIVGNDTNVYVYADQLCEIPPNSDIWRPITVAGGFNSSVLTNNATNVDLVLFSQTTTAESYVVHSSSAGGAITLGLIDCTATVVVNGNSYTPKIPPLGGYIVPVTVTIGGDTDDGSEDGPANNIGGMAYQILALMPILVILSLIAVVIKPYLIDRYL